MRIMLISMYNAQRYQKTIVHVRGDSMDGDMECVDIRQIYDKFPTLRELFAQGPKHAFYLVKFWVRVA